MDNNEYRIKLINIFKHLHTVNKHKWLVFKFACKVGIPWRGLVHDLSKYSPTLLNIIKEVKKVQYQLKDKKQE